MNMVKKHNDHYPVIGKSEAAMEEAARSSSLKSFPLMNPKDKFK